MACSAAQKNASVRVLGADRKPFFYHRWLDWAKASFAYCPNPLAIELMVTLPGTTNAAKKISEPPKRGLRRDDEVQSAGLTAFLAAFEQIIIEEPTYFTFNTSISRKHLKRFWTWVSRDVLPGMEMKFDGLLESGNTVDAAIQICINDMLAGVKQIRAEADNNYDLDRRITIQIGGEEVRERLDMIMVALKSRHLITKAGNFGKAAISLTDDAALGAALQSLPLKDPMLTGLLMHVIVGQTAHPQRLVTAASAVAGKADEDAIRGVGMGPLADAILAHAQNQLAKMAPMLVGMSDIDGACQHLDRYQRLIRSVSSYLELAHNSRWTTIIAELTKQASFKLEPRLREVTGDIAQSMRRPRDGSDRFDADALLAALNGMYLLHGVREARDALALNALFEQIWGETGQSIEVVVKRSLEDFRANPQSEGAARRLDTGIKMAEIRFNTEYAEVLRRARDKFSQRAGG